MTLKIKVADYDDMAENRLEMAFFVTRLMLQGLANS